MFSALKKNMARFPSGRLAGKRVYLRPPAPADWRDWAAVRSANREHLQPFEPRWAENNLKQDFFARRLQRQYQDWRTGRGRYFLVFRYDDTLIGGMNINNICRGAAQYASLGYWIDKGQQGRGFMAEALGLTLEYCFSELRLHRVHAACVPGNQRSQNMLLAAGFREEGFAEKYLQINGAWRDHILYGLTLENWKESRASGAAGFAR